MVIIALGTQPKIFSPVSVLSPSSLESVSKKNPVTASIIAISLNAAVNYLRYQYCLVSVETVITVLSCTMLEQHC